MHRLSRAVTVLLTLNIAVFLAGFTPAWREAIAGAAALWLPANPHFQPWQVVSYLFLHGDLGHIFFNMFALVSFGTVLEREWGATRFLVFYLLCGIGAGLVQLGLNWHEYTDLHLRLVSAGLKPTEIDTLLAAGRGRIPSNASVGALLHELYWVYASRTVGASGAIYGLLVAFGFLHPNAKLAVMFVPVPVAAKILIPILLGLDLFSGLTGFSLFGAGVAHFAHLGGALIGFLLMLLWRRRSVPDPLLRAEG